MKTNCKIDCLFARDVTCGIRGGLVALGVAVNAAALPKPNSAWPLRNALLESGKTVLDPPPFFLYPLAYARYDRKIPI